MKHFLEIVDFGPIKKAKIDLSKHTLIIGPQASGKSIIVRLIHIIHQVNSDSYSKEDFENQLEFYGLKSFVNEQSTIKFDSETFSLIYEKGSYLFQVNAIGELITQFLFRQSLYIPVERFLIPYLSASIWSLIRNRVNLDGPILEFADNFENARNHISNYSIDFLDLTYQLIDGREFVTVNNQSTLLKEAASGFQSILPLLLTFERMKEVRGFCIIEEPELNLYPKTQKDLCYFLFSKIKNNNTPKLIITTHSPFVMAAFNNLLLAGKLLDKNSDIEQIERIINESAYIPVNSFNAYHIVNGHLKSIFDKETGMIAENMIDDVSGEVRVEFNMLKSAYFD